VPDKLIVARRRAAAPLETNLYPYALTMAIRTSSIAGLLVALLTGAGLAFAAVRYVPAIKDSVVGNKRAGPATAPRRDWTPTSVAGRLSYELSEPSVDARDLVSQPSAPEAAVAASAPEKAPVPGVPPGEYVLNARPITAAPPEPRDRTSEIQKESAASQPIRAQPKQQDRDAER
jgi:hypothetical protein